MRSRSAVAPSRYAAGVGEILALWFHRRALRALALHDLRKGYAGTIGGLAWSVVTPLVPILIFSAIFSLGLRIPLGGAPYIFGFAAAYVPWVLLSAALTAASGSLIAHRYLVKRTLFPVEILPGEAVLVHSLPHACLVGLVSLACAIAGYVHFPDLVAILYFYGCAVALALGAGLLLASVAVMAPDVRQLLPSILNVGFWVTPIAWAPAQLPPGARTLLALNPASYIVTGYRSALMPAAFAPPSAIDAAAFWTAAIGLLLAGSLCFRRLRIYFWDCL
jgi:teichoic acid transport system permease protein